MYFNFKHFEYGGLQLISLYYVDESCNDNKEIWISPQYGMNLCKYIVNGLSIIDFDPEEVKNSFSGSPVLYPTPNRVYNGTFKYSGKDYPQVKNNKPVLTHGLVYNEPFSGVHIENTCESISVTGYIDFAKRSDLFASFPFNHILHIQYTLKKDGVRFDYKIESKETCKEIPFGIAIHPYFMKIDGEYETKIKAPFMKTYKNIEEDLIPTGELEDAAHTAYDLTEYVPVGSLDLDTVYTEGKNNEYAVISYIKTGLKLILECSPEFTHMVIYTPKGEPYFCMENQTCSTDAHNLYSKGFEGVSGLKFVMPESTSRGYVYLKTGYCAV